MTARLMVCTLLGLLVGIPVAAAAQPSTPAAVRQELEAAIKGPQRSAAHVARDKYRHPEQTLAFFGIRPDMRVVEVIPGRGWYTEILAPFLHDHGTLIEATAPESAANPFMRKRAKRYAAKLAADPAVYGRVKREPFEDPDYMALGAPGSADMVLTFRNMHDLMFANVHGEATDIVMQRFLRSAYQVLKPGGVLGITAHRAKADMPAAKSFHLGRLPQAFVIREAEEAGFRLAASSEINANPKDPRTFPVWRLPPTKHNAKAEAIGEADNMTLKFTKPMR
jgi:predicted methyltransferase